jgi:hypothetical protein
VIEQLSKERGLPSNIRSDGVPFASAHTLFNLSKLAVWWLRLGMASSASLETRVLEPLENPFGPQSVTHVAGTFCNPCDRAGPKGFGAEGRN